MAKAKPKSKTAAPKPASKALKKTAPVLGTSPGIKVEIKKPDGACEVKVTINSRDAEKFLKEMSAAGHIPTSNKKGKSKGGAVALDVFEFVGKAAANAAIESMGYSPASGKTTPKVTKKPTKK